MDSDESPKGYKLNVGDIVTESILIIPPDRKPWTGIIVYIDRDHYSLHVFLEQTEDMVGIHWFQSGCTETLPASVIELVQKAKKDK